MMSDPLAICGPMFFRAWPLVVVGARGTVRLFRDQHGHQSQLRHYLKLIYTNFRPKAQCLFPFLQSIIRYGGKDLDETCLEGHEW